MKIFVAKSKVRVNFEQQILVLLLVFHQTLNLSRSKFAEVARQVEAFCISYFAAFTQISCSYHLLDAYGKRLAETDGLSFRYYAVLRRRNYVTPTSYLELIKTFKSLLGKKRLQILTLKTRYLKGLEKLDFASSQVTNI